MEFRVNLDMFRGPLDLLLHLVRKHELDVADIPMALVTEQFLEHLAVLEQLDVNAVGEFVEMASTLIEIKSRMVLPHAGEEGEALPDPRDELVARLLEYKQYRDAASMLEERSRAWQQRMARVADEGPAPQPTPEDQPIEEVELWDLVSAFGRLVRERQATQPASVIYDETPIQAYMEQVRRRVAERGRLALRQMFEPGMHKSAMIGLFLALLELVRHQRVRAEQPCLLGDIWILPGEKFDEPLDAAQIDAYEPAREPAEPGAA